jgi:hypothetical protein
MSSSWMPRWPASIGSSAASRPSSKRGVSPTASAAEIQSAIGAPLASPSPIRLYAREIPMRAATSACRRLRRRRAGASGWPRRRMTSSTSRSSCHRGLVRGPRMILRDMTTQWSQRALHRR